MNITITLGWWLLPAFLTILAWVCTIPAIWEDMNGTGLGTGLTTIFVAGAALIATLAFWLVYFAALYFLE